MTDAIPLSAGDTSWVLAASALVLFMTPGLAFFYGGFVRNKNVLGTIMQSFIVMGLVGVLWVVIGYTLAFGPDAGGWGIIGNLDNFGLKGVGALGDSQAGPGIPHEAFMIFQAMFAIITPALITGAFAERAKFGPFLIFIAAWSLLVYAPVAHWVFDVDGWIAADIKGIDFAGGTAIHVNAGAAALAAAFVFGRRKGFKEEPMEPHDITMIVLGASILWFGWFGFNAGSAGAASPVAVNAFTVTNTAAAAAALSWTPDELVGLRQAQRRRRRGGRGRRARGHHTGFGLRAADGGDRHRRRGRRALLPRRAVAHQEQHR